MHCLSPSRNNEARLALKKSLAPFPTAVSSQGAQEIQQILLLAARKRRKVLFYFCRFGAIAGVSLNRRDQVRSTSVMQQENALSESPQRRRAELIAPRSALRHVVSQSRTHVVDLEVGECVDRSVPQ